MDACTKGKMTCETATAILIGMLTGDLGDTCDIVNILYENDLSFKNYRGIKDQYLSGTAYVF